MLTLPTPSRWRRFRLEIQRLDYLSPVVGGRLTSVTAGWPLWALEAEPRFRTEAEAEAFAAFLDGLRGPQTPFLAGPERPLPLAHAKGLPGGWNGDAATWSINVTRDQLTLAGVNAQTVLMPGDRVGFRWKTGGEDRATMVKVITGAAGAAPSLTVEPPVPRVVPGAAVAHVFKPQALFKLTPETEVGAMESSRTRFASVAALQTLLP